MDFQSARVRKVNLGYFGMNKSFILDSKSFVIRVYHANTKPYSFNELLEDFVHEAIILWDQGLNYDNQKF